MSKETFTKKAIRYQKALHVCGFIRDIYGLNKLTGVYPEFAMIILKEQLADLDPDFDVYRVFCIESSYYNDFKCEERYFPIYEKAVEYAESVKLTGWVRIHPYSNNQDCYWWESVITAGLRAPLQLESMDFPRRIKDIKQLIGRMEKKLKAEHAE